VGGQNVELIFRATPRTEPLIYLTGCRWKRCTPSQEQKFDLVQYCAAFSAIDKFLLLLIQNSHKQAEYKAHKH